MKSAWTFSQKVAAGFAVVVVLAVLISLVAVYALVAVAAAKDGVLTGSVRNRLEAEKMQGAVEWRSSAARGFLLTREPRFVDAQEQAGKAYQESLSLLKTAVTTDEGRRLLAGVETSGDEYDAAIGRILDMRRTDASIDSVAQAFDQQVLPKRDVFRSRMAELEAQEERELASETNRANELATFAEWFVAFVALLAVVVAVSAGFVLSRVLGRQVGTAISQVESAAAELQASANQQATGAREQATAMSEIATTIRELLTTSNQIAEGSKRVARIAADTAAAADAGELTVDRSNAAIGAIRDQVEVVVTHMLELGRKSQQIGSVLEIVSELAEQTNILAINATIEAAGAGEAGKRFGVVADEIRKLADRVASSTKEIRGLIDDVRGAVNTTVMATEGGAKSVEAGSRQFSDAATAFRQIAELILTTTDAAREIELSTKQQATAVEQVNEAIASVAQTTKETETSSLQTLQTASQLAGLSKDLLRLVRSNATR